MDWQWASEVANLPVSRLRIEPTADYRSVHSHYDPSNSDTQWLDRNAGADVGPLGYLPCQIDCIQKQADDLSKPIYILKQQQ